jgi:hypothetical protein
MEAHNHRCKTCPYWSPAPPQGGGYNECRFAHPSAEKGWRVSPDYFCGEHPDIKRMVSDFLLRALAAGGEG